MYGVLVLEGDCLLLRAGAQVEVPVRSARTAGSGVFVIQSPVDVIVAAP